MSAKNDYIGTLRNTIVCLENRRTDMRAMHNKAHQRVNETQRAYDEARNDLSVIDKDLEDMDDLITRLADELVKATRNQ